MPATDIGREIENFSLDLRFVGTLGTGLRGGSKGRGVGRE